MKLSEKGWDKVLDEALYFDDDIANEALEWSNTKQQYKLRDMEFEPDDFQEAVVLSIEEAKELALKLMSNADFFFLQTGEFDHDTDAWWLYLTDKIEQAEKGNETK